MSSVVISIIVLIALMILGVPVPFCFAASAMFMVFVSGYDPSFLLPVGFNQLNSITILAILFFIMLGGVMSTGGIAKRILDFTDAIVGRIKGGMGVVTIVACALFGAITGTNSSAVAAIGGIMMPRMKKEGYPEGYTASLVACSAVESQMIPPSVPMILFAWVTGQSVLGCFLSTVGPGVLRLILYAAINLIMVRRMDDVKEVHLQNSSESQLKRIYFQSKRASLALLMPILILGTIYGGVATPTEAAAITLVAAIVISLWVYRDMTYRELVKVLAQTVCTTGVIILMLYFVAILSRVYTMERIPHLISKGFVGISENKFIVLLMVNIFLIVVGMLMDDVSGTVLVAPLLMPTMEQLGVHPLHFAAIVGTNLGLGNITPPTAPILYLSGRVGGVSFDKMFWPTMVLLVLGSLPILIVTTYWPDLSLFLPRLLMGIE